MLSYIPLTESPCFIFLHHIFEVVSCFVCIDARASSLLYHILLCAHLGCTWWSWHLTLCMQGPGRFEDAVVVCIRDNPEPVVFKVACDGFRPELELDKKVLHFDKVLLHRSGRLTLCSFLSVPSHLKASFWEGGAIAAPPPSFLYWVRYLLHSWVNWDKNAVSHWLKWLNWPNLGPNPLIWHLFPS